jgi:NTE family protein
MEQDSILIDLALQGVVPMEHSPGACWIGSSKSRDCRIAAISGTSAGAMNAAVLADGWTSSLMPQ